MLSSNILCLSIYFVSSESLKILSGIFCVSWDFLQSLEYSLQKENYEEEKEVLGFSMRETLYVMVTIVSQIGVT